MAAASTAATVLGAVAVELGAEGMGLGAAGMELGAASIGAAAMGAAGMTPQPPSPAATTVEAMAVPNPADWTTPIPQPQSAAATSGVDTTAGSTVAARTLEPRDQVDLQLDMNNEENF